jgi:ABC-type dipeptide/oligopeptide/nickel transport system permease subunit
VLDDYERNALREVEWQLSIEDPCFVRNFDLDQEGRSDRSRHRSGARIALAITLVLCTLLLLVASPAGALAAAGTAALVWLVWRYSSHLDPQSSP